MYNDDDNDDDDNNGVEDDILNQCQSRLCVLLLQGFLQPYVFANGFSIYSYVLSLFSRSVSFFYALRFLFLRFSFSFSILLSVQWIFLPYISFSLSLFLDGSFSHSPLYPKRYRKTFNSFSIATCSCCVMLWVHRILLMAFSL